MEKFIKNLFMVMILAAFSVSFTSCGSDDDDDPSATVGRLTITNNSTYTLDSFMVNFTNDKGEIITRESKGTLKPKDKITVDIPIGASYYYMSTYVYGDRFFSVDYATTVRTQVLTDQIVGNWTANN